MSALLDELIEILKPESPTVTPAEANRVPAGGEAVWVTRNFAARMGRRMLVSRDQNGVLKVFEDLNNSQRSPRLVNVTPIEPPLSTLASLGLFLIAYLWA